MTSLGADSLSGWWLWRWAKLAMTWRSCLRSWRPDASGHCGWGEKRNGWFRRQSGYMRSWRSAGRAGGLSRGGGKDPARCWRFAPVARKIVLLTLASEQDRWAALPDGARS